MIEQLYSNRSQFSPNNNSPIPFANYLKIEKLKENIGSACSIDGEKIISDEKLSFALEMYLGFRNFQVKHNLDLITILEIQKPKYEVSAKSKQSLKLIKSIKIKI